LLANPSVPATLQLVWLLFLANKNKPSEPTFQGLDQEHTFLDCRSHCQLQSTRTSHSSAATQLTGPILLGFLASEESSLSD
jgi:hypothetical protein